MNGYTMLAESYKKLLQEGKVTEEEAKKNIKVMEFLAECSEEEINIMFDSAAFNEIMKEYVRRAINNADLGEEEEKEEIKSKIMNELRWLLSEKTAGEIMKSCNK